MSMIRTIFHTTKDGRYIPLAALTDEEFEEFLDEHGFEVVSSEGTWNPESRENTVKSIFQVFNSMHEKIIDNLTDPFPEEKEIKADNET